MAESRSFDTLGDLLDAVEEAASEGDGLSIAAVKETVGPRSFGPLLLLPGLMLASPISGIPGTPTATALIVSLIAVQALLGRCEVWVPRRVAQATLSTERLGRILRFARPVARVVDRVVRRRWTFAAEGGPACRRGVLSAHRGHHAANGTPAIRGNRRRCGDRSVRSRHDRGGRSPDGGRRRRVPRARGRDVRGSDLIGGHRPTRRGPRRAAAPLRGPSLRRSRDLDQPMRLRRKM